MKHKSIREEMQFGWKSIRDMADKGIGHSGLRKLVKKIREKEKENNSEK